MRAFIPLGSMLLAPLVAMASGVTVDASRYLADVTQPKAPGNRGTLYLAPPDVLGWANFNGQSLMPSAAGGQKISVEPIGEVAWIGSNYLRFRCVDGMGGESDCLGAEADTIGAPGQALGNAEGFRVSLVPGKPGKFHLLVHLGSVGLAVGHSVKVADTPLASGAGLLPESSPGKVGEGCLIFTLDVTDNAAADARWDFEFTCRKGPGKLRLGGVSLLAGASGKSPVENWFKPPPPPKGPPADLLACLTGIPDARAALDGIAPIVKRPDGSFVGLTANPLTWEDARNLARRAGGAVFALGQSPLTLRADLDWLAAKLPCAVGETAWAEDGGQATVVEDIDIGKACTLESRRRAYLQWNRAIPVAPATQARPPVVAPVPPQPALPQETFSWEWSVEPRFDRALPFGGDESAIVLDNGAWRRIDKTGKDLGLVPLHLLPWTHNERGLAGMMWKGKVGLLDKAGNVLAEAVWDELREPHHGFVPVKRGGKWGYVGPGGKLIPCEWDDVWRFSPEGYAVVTRAGKRGIIDRTGKVIIQPIWDGVLNFCKEGIGAVRKGDFWKDPGVRWGLVNTQGKLLCNPQYNLNWQDRRFDLGVIPVRENGGKGKSVFLGIDGQPLPPGEGERRLAGAAPVVHPESPPPMAIPFVLATGHPAPKPRQGLQMKKHERPLTGVFQDRHGAVTTNIYYRDNNSAPPETQSLLASDGTIVLPGVAGNNDFTCDYIPYANPPKYGWMDVNGKILVEPRWDAVRLLGPNRLAVMSNGKMGIADAQGKILVEPRWDSVTPLKYGQEKYDRSGEDARPDSPWYKATDNHKSVLLRPDGQPCLPATMPQAREIDFYGPSKIIIKESQGSDAKELFSIYDPASGDKTPFPQARAVSWNWQCALDGLLWIQDKSDSRWHLCLANGKDTGHSQWKKPAGWSLKEGFGLVGEVDSFRFLKPDGTPHGVDTWHAARNFQNGMAAVMRDGKWGFLLPDGKPDGELRWDEVLDASPDGFAFAKTGDKWGIIDKSGKVVREPFWDEVRTPKLGLAAVRVGPFWGFSTTSGSRIALPVWDRVENFRSLPADIPGSGNHPQRAFAIVSIGRASAVIDNQGRLLCDPRYSEIRRSGDVLEAYPRFFKNQPYEPGHDIIKPMDNATGSVVSRSPAGKEEKEMVNLSSSRAWMARSNARDSLWALCDASGAPLSPFEWGRPPTLDSENMGSNGTWLARTPAKQYGLISDAGSILVPPAFDGLAWVAPGVAAVWSDDNSGLVTSTGVWRFKDSEKSRIARFGIKNHYNLQYPTPGHGLVIIEDPPKWGYVRIKSQPKSAPFR